MGLLKKISDLFMPAKTSADTGYWIAARCRHCGETVRTRVNLGNDLSLDYGEDVEGVKYLCRKTLMGDQGCFQRIEVELFFDSQKRLVDRRITGGEFVDD
jgi:hypothetical protein